MEEVLSLFAFWVGPGVNHVVTPHWPPFTRSFTSITFSSELSFKVVYGKTRFFHLQNDIRFGSNCFNFFKLSSTVENKLLLVQPSTSIWLVIIPARSELSISSKLIVSAILCVVEISVCVHVEGVCFMETIACGKPNFIGELWIIVSSEWVINHASEVSVTFQIRDLPLVAKGPDVNVLSNGEHLCSFIKLSLSDYDCCDKNHGVLLHVVVRSDNNFKLDLTLAFSISYDGVFTFHGPTITGLRDVTLVSHSEWLKFICWLIFTVIYYSLNQVIVISAGYDLIWFRIRGERIFKARWRRYDWASWIWKLVQSRFRSVNHSKVHNLREDLIALHVEETD